MRRLIFALLLPLAFAGQAWAQEDGDDPVAGGAAQVANEDMDVFVIVCDAKPGQMLILDDQGDWMPDAREAKIAVAIGPDAQPSIECTMWTGLFRPTNPLVKNWTVNQIKSVNLVEFQKMVDDLQTDPSAIRKALANNQPANAAAGNGDAAAGNAGAGNGNAAGNGNGNGNGNGINLNGLGNN